MDAAWLSPRGAEAQEGHLCRCLFPELFLSSAGTEQLSCKQSSASVWLLRAGGAAFRAGVVVLGGGCRDLFCFHHGL